MGQTQDFQEFVDSNADVAAAGRVRLRSKGAVLQQSVDGGGWVNVPIGLADQSTIERFRVIASSFLGSDFGDWREDFIGAGNFDSTANNTALSLAIANPGGGKYQFTVGAGTGWEYHAANGYPLCGDVAADPWMLAWKGCITTMSSTFEMAMMGWVKWQATPHYWLIGGADGASQYMYVGVLGSTSQTTIVVTIWDGTTQRVQDTLIPITVGIDQEVILVHDGMSTMYLIVNGVVSWSSSDMRNIGPGTAGIPMFCGRNGANAAKVIHDTMYAAGAR